MMPALSGMLDKNVDVDRSRALTLEQPAKEAEKAQRPREKATVETESGGSVYGRMMSILV